MENDVITVKEMKKSGRVAIFDPARLRGLVWNGGDHLEFYQTVDDRPAYLVRCSGWLPLDVRMEIRTPEIIKVHLLLLLAGRLEKRVRYNQRKGELK